MSEKNPAVVVEHMEVHEGATGIVLAGGSPGSSGIEFLKGLRAPQLLCAPYPKTPASGVPGMLFQFLALRLRENAIDLKHVSSDSWNLPTGYQASGANLPFTIAVEDVDTGFTDQRSRTILRLKRSGWEAIRHGLPGPPFRDLEEALESLQTVQQRLESLQTGGDTFCYWMLYHFDLTRQIANNFCIIRKGEYSLYNVHVRIVDLDGNLLGVTKDFGELNSPAIFLMSEWPLPEAVYYRAFFHARNGSWHQDLVLRRSASAGCWLAATRVVGANGQIRFEHIDNEFVREFGEPTWRS